MSTFDFVSNIAAAGAVASQLEDDWVAGLTTAAVTKIKSRWDAIVGTDVLWTKNVADPSNANWKPFVNPDFSSKSGRSADIIKSLQRKKLNSSFTKAKAAHDDKFASAGTKFIDAVVLKKANWTANVANTLGLTGDRLLGVRGPASQHVRAAVGDSTFLRDVSSGYTGIIDPTILETEQVPYIDARLRGAFKAAFEGILIQAGVFLLAGVIDDVTALNVTLNRLLKGFVHEGTTEPPTCFINFAISGGVTLHTHLDNDDVEPV
jgi:hypothetical protein